MANLNQPLDPKMDRDKLMEELEDLRAMMAGFFENVPGALIVLDRQWRLVYLNNNAKKFFEGDKGPFIGRPLEEIYPKEHGYMLSPNYLRELLKGKENTIKKYSNYNHRWYQISAYSSDFGIFIRLEDITHEMLINRLLRLNEFSVNHAMDKVFWIKMGGHIIYANKAACDSLGYTKEEITRKKITDIDPSFTKNMWVKFIDELKKSGSKTYESSIRPRDGSNIPVEVTCNYLEYYGDEYLMAFARDITARKRSEKALNEAKAEAELYVDLMSHDINNMNQTAVGYLELALDMMRREGKIDQGHIDLIAKPYDMVLNSSRLIDNVRKVRGEKAGCYESTVIDIGKVLQEVRDSFATVADRDIRIEIARDGECRVAANELLKDIFINLVGNSIKHSHGLLSIRLEMKQVSEDGKAYCRVAVEDNGPGISDEMKHKLLNRLSSENTRARGKGFGLYLIKQLVDDFHGKFWIEDRVPSDYTKGARFVVMLPTVK